MNDETNAREYFRQWCRRYHDLPPDAPDDERRMIAQSLSGAFVELARASNRARTERS